MLEENTSPGRQKNDSSFMGPCQGPGDGDGDEGITFCDEQIQDIGFRIAPAECSEQSSAPLALCGDVLEELPFVPRLPPRVDKRLTNHQSDEKHSTEHDEAPILPAVARKVRERLLGARRRGGPVPTLPHIGAVVGRRRVRVLLLATSGSRGRRCRPPSGESLVRLDDRRVLGCLGGLDSRRCRRNDVRMAFQRTSTEGCLYLGRGRARRHAEQSKGIRHLRLGGRRRVMRRTVVPASRPMAAWGYIVSKLCRTVNGTV